MEAPHGLTIGQRVAQARIARDMSQEQLAGVMERSPSWVSKIERGALPLDRKSVVLKLAQILDVDVNVLEGRAGPLPVPMGARCDLLVRDLRHALMRMGETPQTDPAPTPQFTMRELRKRVDKANRLRQDARFEALSSHLPALLDDLQDALAVATEQDRTDLQVMLVESLHDARAMAKKLGQLDLAWMAAEKAKQVALVVGDPLLQAANAWNHLEVYKTANAPKPAMALALRTIDSLGDGLGSAGPGQVSLLGMMHLQAALISAYWMQRNDADVHLRAAVEAADRLGHDANYYETMFGPTNVAIHRVAISVELGNHKAAADEGEKIGEQGLGRERWARLHIDLARANQHCHRHDKALEELRTAEKIAPDYVRPHPIVQELVGSQLRRSNPELRAFAQRVGILQGRA